MIAPATSLLAGAIWPDGDETLAGAHLEIDAGDGDDVFVFLVQKRTRNAPAAAVSIGGHGDR